MTDDMAAYSSYKSESFDYFRSSNETRSTFTGVKYLHITKKGSGKEVEDRLSPCIQILDNKLA